MHSCFDTLNPYESFLLHFLCKDLGTCTVMDDCVSNSAAHSLCSIQNFAKITFLYTKHDGSVAQSKMSSREDCRPQKHQSCAGDNFELQTYPLQCLRPLKSVTQGREIMFCSPLAYLMCSSWRPSLEMHHLHLYYRGNRGTKSYGDLPVALPRAGLLFPTATLRPSNLGSKGLPNSSLNYHLFTGLISLFKVRL